MGQVIREDYNVLECEKRMCKNRGDRDVLCILRKREQGISCASRIIGWADYRKRKSIVSGKAVCQVFRGVHGLHVQQKK